MTAPLFYRAYDALYAQKDYDAEISAVLSAFRAGAGRAPDKVLELGCGTGNHTRVLARRCKSVVALETDPVMARIAEEKLAGEGIANAAVTGKRVEELSGRGFDLAVALFHVITYIGDFESLTSFFSAVSERLNPGSMFFFDCWNGVAALHDPPKNIVKRAAFGENEIVAEITAVTDLMAQRTTLTYRLRVVAPDDSVLEEGSHAFTQSLWTPREIRAALSLAGFSGITMHAAFDFSRSASANDWKMVFSCKTK